MDDLIHIARAPRIPREPKEKQVILVADDEACNRELLRDVLTGDGYDVLLAEDGRRALEIVESASVDLVLLDIMMPEIDGFGVLERMRQDTRLRHIPVLVISAMTQEDASIRCIELGAEDFLMKPFNMILLRARLNACLERKVMRDQELRYRQQLEAEKEHVNQLLEGLFPDLVVRELKQTGTFRPRRFPSVGVLFCDIAGFTAYCEHHSPEEVVGRLQKLTKVFESVFKQHRLEKIKLIGDGFLATAGLLDSHSSPVLSSIHCGLDLIAAVKAVTPDWDLRVGIHYGDILAGVVGTKQYWFDVWGDAVNTASRVQSTGEPGFVHVSGFAWQQVDHACRGEVRLIDVPGKGQMEIVRVTQVSTNP